MIDTHDIPAAAKAEALLFLIADEMRRRCDLPAVTLTHDATRAVSLPNPFSARRVK